MDLGNSSLAVRTHDQDGRVSQIDSKEFYTYGYDDASRVTGITNTNNSALTWSYGYDLLDRVTSSSKTGSSFGWTYDADGNRLTQTGTNASTFTPSATSNRLASTSGALTRTYSYDLAGNTTGYGGLTFAYNNAGRRTSVTATTGSVSKARDWNTVLTGSPTGSLTLGTGTNRMLVVVVSWEKATAPAANISVGGQSPTSKPVAVQTGSSSRDGHDVYIFNEAKIAAMSGSTISVTAGSYAATTMWSYATLAGVNQSTPVTTPGFKANTTATSLSINNPAPQAASYSIIVVTNDRSQNNLHTFPSGYTEKLDTNAAAGLTFALGDRSNTAAGAVTVTESTAGQRWLGSHLGFNAAAAGANATYVTNALGQRVKKVTGGVTTYFVYDEAGHLLGEYTSAGALIQETVWLGDIPVATLRPNGGSVDIFYVHTDHLNTPRKVTRPSDNALRWRWDPDAFGNGAANENPQSLGAFAYNLRFPGQYYDNETGLNYNYFRDYDPQTGRYVESDPIGLKGGANTYTYALNNPIRHFDSNGLIACDGTWRSQGWNPSLPRIFRGCICYWLCMSCDGPVMWSGIKESLPSTTGRIIFIPGRPASEGDIEEGNACACAKPGPEKDCSC